MSSASELGILSAGASSSSRRVITPWPERLLKSPLGDPFYFGTEAKDVPLAIDFGSHRVRAGFSSHSDPHLDMPCVFSRYKLEKSALEEDEEVGMRTYCGNDVLLLPSSAKKNLPFDLNVPFHFDGMEYLLDHIMQRMLTKNRPGATNDDYLVVSDESDEDTDDEFEPSAKKRKLGDSGLVGDSMSHKTVAYYDASIEHPLLLTEAPLTPRYVRGSMMQLAYEAYGTSGLCFGVDALFSLLYDHHHNYVGCRVSNSAIGGDSRSESASLWQGSKVGVHGLEKRMGAVGNAQSIIYPDHSLVVCSGYETTHILPVVGGELVNSGILRLGLGGAHATELLNKSVQLLYPQHKAAWTRLQPSASLTSPGAAAAEALKEQECLVATPDYVTVLRDLQHATIDPSFYRHFQFPYDPKPIVTISEEERSAREAKRLENAERMREVSRRKREQKLVEKCNRLDELEYLFKARAEMDEEEFRKCLEKSNFTETDDWATAASGGPRDRVVQEIAETRKYLERIMDELVLNERQAPGWNELTLEQKIRTQDIKYPLTLIDDSDLSEVEVPIKRAHLKLRAMAELKIRRSHERDLAKAKAGTLAPPAQKPISTASTVLIDVETGAETKTEKGVLQKQEVKIVLDATSNLSICGLEELQIQRRAIWARLQRRTKVVHETKEALKRANDEANAATVSDLANLSSDPNSMTAIVSGPQGGKTVMNGVGSIANAIGARSSRAKKSAMLMFTAAADARLDLDEDGLERMAMMRMDHADMTSVRAAQKAAELKQQLERQTGRAQGDKELLEMVDDEILSRLEPEVLRQREAESCQLSLSVNRIRCPELLFQPSIVGIEQMGLSESLYSVLTRFSATHDNLGGGTTRHNSSAQQLRSTTSVTQQQLLRNVYLTGGNCSYPNIGARLYAEMVADLPVGTALTVVQSSSPTLNAWRGAALFANNKFNRDNFFVDRATYLEEGAERLHERFMGHFASNRV